jgi:hypothetical protein
MNKTGNSKIWTQVVLKEKNKIWTEAELASGQDQLMKKISAASSLWEECRDVTSVGAGCLEIETVEEKSSKKLDG